jgi:predicted membrane-bound mannosyltransferase
VVVALGVFVVAGILLFTWFGRNWGALADLGRAVPHLAARATGEGHEKPFGYYLGLLSPMFIVSLPAGVGIYVAVCEARSGVRKTGLWLAVYSLVVFLIYSAIPYKTPWLALNLWLPLALLCGLGIEYLWIRFNSAIGRCIAILILAVMLTVAGQQTKVLAFDQPADEKNPLAYAQTVEDMLRLPTRLEQLAKEGNLSQPLIAVVAADPWPLPWYLRKFSRVGFWQPEQDPGAADFYITSPAVAEKLGDKLKDRRPEYFGVRPEVVIILWPPPSP